VRRPPNSQSCGDESAVLQLHAGNGEMGDLGERFLNCFVLALDDAELPADPGFRAALGAYMRWAVTMSCPIRPWGSADETRS
jgi:hemoglobin